MSNRTAYALFNTSASTAKMIQKGLRAHIGAHGEPPLGVNYHKEMFFAKAGGLSNYEVRRISQQLLRSFCSAADIFDTGYSRSYLRCGQDTRSLGFYWIYFSWKTRRLPSLPTWSRLA